MSTAKQTAVFFILARIESTAFLYFLRKGVKLHFYSLGTVCEEKMRVSIELEFEEQTTVDAETWISLIKQYANPTELTAELLNTLIETSCGIAYRCV